MFVCLRICSNRQTFINKNARLELWQLKLRIFDLIVKTINKTWLKIATHMWQSNCTPLPLQYITAKKGSATFFYHCSMFNMQRTIYDVQCTMYNVQRTMDTYVIQCGFSCSTKHLMEKANDATISQINPRSNKASNWLMNPPKGLCWCNRVNCLQRSTFQAHVFAVLNQPIKPCCPCRAAGGPVLSSLKWVHLNFHFADPPKGENKGSWQVGPYHFSLLAGIIVENTNFGKNNGWQTSYTPHHNHLSCQKVRLWESIRTNQKWMAKLWTRCHHHFWIVFDFLMECPRTHLFLTKFPCRTRKWQESIIVSPLNLNNNWETHKHSLLPLFSWREKSIKPEMMQFFPCCCTKFHTMQTWNKCDAFHHFKCCTKRADNTSQIKQTSCLRAGQSRPWVPKTLPNWAMKHRKIRK